MSVDRFSFKVGNIDCAVLLDGASVIGKAGILKRYLDATEAEYRRAYADPGLSLDEAVSSFNCLVAKVGEHTVLVDTGEGGKPKGGYVPESLRLAGIEPDAITLVVITHSHGDHVLGLLSNNDTPVFPRATYVISKEELAFWRGRIDAGAEEQRPIISMIEARGLRVIDMDEQIIPGVNAVPIPGHTPGHIAVLVESEGEKLIHMADLVHIPIQFAHPEWSPTLDADTNISVPTRRAALARAADENMLALFYHLSFPGLGRIKQAQQGFTWEPIGEQVGRRHT